jgi:hypothetical protein
MLFHIVFWLWFFILAFGYAFAYWVVFMLLHFGYAFAYWLLVMLLHVGFFVKVLCFLLTRSHSAMVSMSGS